MTKEENSTSSTQAPQFYSKFEGVLTAVSRTGSSRPRDGQSGHRGGFVRYAEKKAELICEGAAAGRNAVTR